MNDPIVRKVLLDRKKKQDNQRRLREHTHKCQQKQAQKTWESVQKAQHMCDHHRTQWNQWNQLHPPETRTTKDQHKGIQWLQQHELLSLKRDQARTDHQQALDQLSANHLPFVPKERFKEPTVPRSDPPLVCFDVVSTAAAAPANPVTQSHTLTDKSRWLSRMEQEHKQTQAHMALVKANANANAPIPISVPIPVPMTKPKTTSSVAIPVNRRPPPNVLDIIAYYARTKRRKEEPAKVQVPGFGFPKPKGTSATSPATATLVALLTKDQSQQQARIRQKQTQCAHERQGNQQRLRIKRLRTLGYTWEDEPYLRMPTKEPTVPCNPPFFTVSFAEQTKEPSKDEDEDDDEDDEDDDELNLKRPRYETHLRTAIARVHSQDLAQQWAWMCAYY